MATRNVLIVFAHPNRHSFNGKLLDVSVEALRSRGHVVRVSDLYEMEFSPTFRKEDLLDQRSRDMSTDRDVIEEQKKLIEADLVIFQFPLHSLSYPAILKGYFDRVMEAGFSFELPSKIFDLARLKGKRALLSFTTGTDKAGYSNRGLLGDINVILWPMINGPLRFNGFDVLAPNIVFGLDGLADKEKALAEWRQRLERIFDERPLFFHKYSDFHDGQLKDEVVDGMSEPHSYTVGQHLGKSLPAVPLTQVVYQDPHDA